MKLINVLSTDPYLNLALEEIYLNEAKEDMFLLWQNYNTIVVGRNQNTFSEINHHFVKEHKIKVVKRLSGGGAVFHDIGNLNFSFIINKISKEKINFQEILKPIIGFLKTLNLDAKFSGRNDILLDNKKISGCSLYMKDNKLLLHGTLLFKTDLENLVHALNVDENKLISKGIKSIKSRVTNIADHLENKTIDNFRKKIIEYFMTQFNCQVKEPDQMALVKAEALAIKKFQTTVWNYGSNIDYTIHNKKRFPGGTLEVYTKVNNSLIVNINFIGDFIGLLPAENLEKHLINTKYEIEEVKNTLEKIDLSLYFFDIKIDNILGMIFKND